MNKILTAIAFIMATTIVTTSCKKDNVVVTDAATVTGVWKLSNMQGTVTTAKTGGTDIFTVSYDSTTKNKTQKLNNDMPEVYPYTLQFNINADETLSTRETRTQNGNFDDTYPGNWFKTGNMITLYGFEHTDFEGDLGSNILTIASVTNTMLVLTYTDKQTTSNPSVTVTKNYTLTFAK